MQVSAAVVRRGGRNSALSSVFCLRPTNYNSVSSMIIPSSSLLQSPSSLFHNIANSKSEIRSGLLLSAKTTTYYNHHHHRNDNKSYQSAIKPLNNAHNVQICSYFGLPQYVSFSTTTNTAHAIIDRNELVMLEQNATTVEMFETVLNGYCAIGDLSKAEDVLAQMEVLATQKTDVASVSATAQVAPQTRHYQQVLQTCLENTATDTSTAQRAQAVLERMEDLTLEAASPSTWGKPELKWLQHVEPTVECYNIVMRTWLTRQNKLYATRIQDIYDRMKEKPNSESFSILIEAWCRHSREGGGSAALFNASNLLLSKMEESANNNCKNNNSISSYDITQSNKVVQHPSLKDYKTVLCALSVTQFNYASAERAYSILLKMERQYQHFNQDKEEELIAEPVIARPDTECYRYVLQSYANVTATSINNNINITATPARKVDEILAHMEDNLINPDQGCYAAAIQAISQTGEAERAEAVLNKMEETNETVGGADTAATWKEYHYVMSAWGRVVGGAARAEGLLEQAMCSIDEKDDDTVVDKLYTAAILAWKCNDGVVDGISSNSNSANAKALLDRRTLLQGNTYNNVDAYNAVLEVCATATSTQKMEAFTVAIQTMRELRSNSSSCKPNNHTYYSMLQCCSDLLNVREEKVRAMETVFKHCCRDGLLNEVVLERFRKHISPKKFQRIVGSNVSFDNKTLPPEWSRNLTNRQQNNGVTINNSNADYEQARITEAANAYKMRGLRSKRGQKLLRGGRS